MNKDFDKQMKEKFSDASLKDIMPSFDKLQTWDELDSKLSKKKRVVPIWFNYAAAVLAGLLLGGGVIKFWFSDGNSKQTIVKHIEVPTTPQPIYINTPKVEIVKKDEVRKMPTSTIQRQVDTDKKVIKNVTAKNTILNDTEEQVATVVPTKSVDTLMPPPTPVVVKAPIIIKKKTVHLLDIMNEDRGTVLNDANENNSNISNVVRLLSPPQAPVSNKEDNGHIVIRTLLNN